MMIINIDLKRVWSYVSEVVLSAAAYLLLVLILGNGHISSYIEKTADEWNDLSGILFSAALAIWLTFVNVRATEFGDYLHFQKADTTYAKAFITAMLIFFLTTVALISCKGIGHPAAYHVALFLLIYSGINLLTMIRNASGLVKLYGVFKRSIGEARRQMEEEELSAALNPPPTDSPSSPHAAR